MKSPRGLDAFRIVIEYENAIPAAEIAALLLSLDKGFDRFVGKKGRGIGEPNVKLGIREIRRGSIDLILEAIDSANKLKDAAVYIAPFASHIIDIASSVVNGIIIPKVNKPDREMVASIAQPVANGNATQINLIVYGNPSFNINANNAKDILGSLAVTQTKLPAPVVHETKHQLIMSEHQSRDLIEGSLTGTAFTVDGQWYVKLLGGSGVLVPTTGSVLLQNGQTYRLSGRPTHGRHGEIVGIEISSAHPWN